MIECDYYHAGPIMQLSDEAAVKVALEGLHMLLPKHFGPAEAEQKSLLHYSVLRAPQAVSHFFPGAFRHLPSGVAPSLDNFYLAGDWIDRAGHRSWSQEKALVTGLEAAAAATAQLRAEGMPLSSAAQGGSEAALLPLEVEATEPHVELARKVNTEVLRPLKSLLPPLPFGLGGRGSGW